MVPYDCSRALHPCRRDKASKALAETAMQRRVDSVQAPAHILRMIRAKIALIAALALPIFGGCGPIPTIAFGSTPADYAHPMVAQKLDIPIYILDETTNVPTDGSTKDEYPVPYTGLSSFVSRDLKGAFDLYFSNVKVVQLADLPSDGRAVIVSVRIDSLGYETQSVTSSSGATAQTNSPYMKWALGMKVAGTEQYFYTLTANSVGSQRFSTKNDVGAAFHELMGDAVSDFLKSYSDKGVHAMIVELDEAGDDSVEADDSNDDPEE